MVELSIVERHDRELARDDLAVSVMRGILHVDQGPWRPKDLCERTSAWSGILGPSISNALNELTANGELRTIEHCLLEGTTPA